MVLEFNVTPYDQRWFILMKRLSYFGQESCYVWRNFCCLCLEGYVIHPNWSSRTM